jgi:NAD(P)-dependent dehydrogenase (short-subunit alcohol dehydrogenase family)
VPDSFRMNAADKVLNKLRRMKRAIFAGTTQSARRDESAVHSRIVMDNQLLHNQNVLITGAGRNIGRSMAIEMAKQGANVFFTDIHAGRLKSVEAELRTCPVKSQGYLSDVSKRDEVDALCRSLHDAGIVIDVLINNVGIRPDPDTLLTLASEDLTKSFETNVFGPLYLTRKIAQVMIESRIAGCILFTTSIHQWAVGQWLSYGVTKAALGMVVKELAVDLGPHGIRVNGIAPGWVNEDEYGQPTPHQWTTLHRSSINPCYIGRAAVYLASDYFSKCTTGTVLKIDSGLSLGSYMVYLKAQQ